MEFKHPFTGIVAGPTGSGKTYFVREFLNRKPVNVKFDEHPFTGIVAGPTGSGKTYFVREFLNRKPVNVKFDEVIWCYGEWQSLYKEIKATFHEGLLDTLPSDDKPRLLVVDDLMHEADKRVVDLFTKGSHHCNISVLFITQNLFHQKSGARDISLNAHYMVIFKNPRDAAQISYLGRQITPENPKFLEAYRDATANPHGYLLIDLKQDTPDVLRFRTNIFDKNVSIYVPKGIKAESVELP
ncbi:hypothetical protein B566_EDAN017847 [Ephemera danica]|nr:hypothetical protein B566_EDAN017847 [Ephemera danica]